MDKFIKVLAVLSTAILSAQVGINTATPTKTLDVNGEMRIRVVPASTDNYNILVVDNEGNVKKIAASSLQTNTIVCPNFLKSISSGYAIHFSSSASVPNPNNPLMIQEKNFAPAAAWITGNIYYYSWSNTTGQPININNFTVNFGSQQCVYNQ